MAIDFECACGKKLKSKDDYAGKKTKCPVCGAVLTVPQTAAVQAAAAAAAAKSKASAAVAQAEDAPLAIDMTETSIRIEPISSGSTETAAVLPKLREPTPAEAEYHGETRNYRVLTSKDMGFFAKFDAVKLEETLNTWASKGWNVRTVFPFTHTSHSGVINDLLVVLEK